MSDILLIGIENWTTGDRGSIDPDDIREGNLIAPAANLHQRLKHESNGDFEVRVVQDGRDISQYEGTWTLHFDDGSSVSEGDWKAALQQAFNSGKTLVDVDGVVPIPEAERDVANQVIANALDDAPPL